MPSRLITSAAALLAAFSLSGCLLMQDKTLGESLDEASAGTSIKTQLMGSGLDKFGEVDVEVADRFVLLSGRVPSDADKAEAERLAWTVKSVDEVANELIVGKRDIGRDANDLVITQQVRTRLLADEAIKGVNYNVQVNSGVVFLLGIAQTEDELRRAAEHASKVKGVQKVVSYVKMRDRAGPPAPIEQAQGAPREETLAGAPGSQSPASQSQAPAPIVPPDRAPTTRGQYTDPYAAGATPPPGARPNNFGLQSAPIPPAN
jgi:osmotically-inducible protein OsmY